MARGLPPSGRATQWEDRRALGGVHVGRPGPSGAFPVPREPSALPASHSVKALELMPHTVRAQALMQGALPT